MHLILNQSQAEAVYSAMCELNNVSARLDTFIEAESIHCREISGGRVVIHKTPESPALVVSEEYPDQSAFATAYGLDTGNSRQDIPRCRTEACVNENAVGEPCRSCKGSSNFHPWDDHGGEHQSAVAAAAGGLTQTAIER